MPRPRHAELLPSQGFDTLPLFGGREHVQLERTQSTVVDPDERMAWARKTLLASNLDTFTAEDVRRFTVQMRPHYIESGNWIGRVFTCPLFTMVHHERAGRAEAKARYIIRYTLTDEGRDARREIQAMKEASR